MSLNGFHNTTILHRIRRWEFISLSKAIRNHLLLFACIKIVRKIVDKRDPN